MGAVSRFCCDSSNFVFEVDLGAEQHLVCIEVHQIDPLECCCQTVIDAFSGLFLKWHVGCCQPFVVETASVQQLGVRSLDAVNFSCRWISVLVFSSDSLIVRFSASMLSVLR
jgi:hypothetical protein